LRGGVVELGVAADFGEEEGRGEQGHPGHAVYGLRDLHLHLVFEEFRVLEGRLVEDEDVGEGCDYEVEEGAGEPGIGLSAMTGCKARLGKGTYHMIRKREMNWR
jgi:hypothetical protein